MKYLVMHFDEEHVSAIIAWSFDTCIITCIKKRHSMVIKFIIYTSCCAVHGKGLPRVFIGTTWFTSVSCCDNPVFWWHVQNLNVPGNKYKLMLHWMYFKKNKKNLTLAVGSSFGNYKFYCDPEFWYVKNNFILVKCSYFKCYMY